MAFKKILKIKNIICSNTEGIEIKVLNKFIGNFSNIELHPVSRIQIINIEYNLVYFILINGILLKYQMLNFNYFMHYESKKLTSLSINLNKIKSTI